MLDLLTTQIENLEREDSRRREKIRILKNSLKAEIFLISWFLADFDSGESNSKNSKISKLKSKLQRKKGGNNPADSSNLPEIKDLLKSLERLSQINFDFLWREGMEETFIKTLVNGCFHIIEKPLIIKKTINQEAVFGILQQILSRYGENFPTLFIQTTTRLANLLYNIVPI